MTNNQAISDKIFLSRVKKSFKIGQGQRTLISTFMYFLAAIPGVYFVGEASRWAMCSPKFEIF